MMPPTPETRRPVVNFVSFSAKAAKAMQLLIYPRVRRAMILYGGTHVLLRDVLGYVVLVRRRLYEQSSAVAEREVCSLVLSHAVLHAKVCVHGQYRVEAISTLVSKRAGVCH